LGQTLPMLGQPMPSFGMPGAVFGQPMVPGNAGGVGAAHLLSNPAMADMVAMNPLLAGHLQRLAQNGMPQTVPAPAMLMPMTAMPFSAVPTAAPGLPAVDPSNPRLGFHPDVQELADHFGMDERITKQLDDEMKKRKETHDQDIAALYEVLELARNPAGLLSVKIREMKEGMFVGKPKKAKDIQEVAKKYKLDDQAKSKLAEVMEQRQETREADLAMISKHLEVSNKPSSMVMMLLKKIRSGETVPQPDKRIAAGSYADMRKKSEERRKKDARNGGRDRRNKDRSRSRERRRSPSRDKRRSKSRDKKSKSRDRRDRKSRSRDRRSSSS